MTDRSHHGEGQHDERDVAMPAMPGTGLVVVEPQFILRGFEAILDRPAMSLHFDQSFDACSSRALGREVGEISIRDVAADQQAARPRTQSIVAVFGRIEIGQLAIRPVMQPRAFGSFASRQATPA